jgi:hypothetical protein
VNRRALLRAVGLSLTAGLAGCSAEGDAEPTEPGGERATPTATASPTLRSLTPTTTAAPTETPTPTPTPTPTATPTPTPTPTPEPEDVTVGVGEWAAIETGQTTYEVQVTRWRTRDELTNGIRGAMRPPEDETWVETFVWLRNRGREETRVGYTQWTMRDFRGIEHAPHRRAMRTLADTLARRRVLEPIDGVRARVVFATGDPSDLEFVVTPFGSGSGPTVRIVTR